MRLFGNAGAGRCGLRTVAAFLLAFALAACQSSAPPPATGMAPAPTFSPAASTFSAEPVLGQAEPRAHAVYVADLTTGRALHEENAEALRYPASLTKMMTLYLLFEAIGAGRVSLDDGYVVSEWAAAQPPAKIGLEAGTRVLVRDLAQALAVRSANDAATVVAENMAGSEEAFARAMTAKARALGMMQTRFTNASGLPDPHQVTSARDMAILGRALRQRFPRFAHYFTSREFHYGGRRFEATNKLLGKVEGVDGMKTGYIRMSGYNLVATARRGGRDIIVVMFGGQSGRARDAHVTELLERHLGGSASMAASALPAN